MAMAHALPCRVYDLVALWKREGNTAAVVNGYDGIVAELDASDARPPS